MLNHQLRAGYSIVTALFPEDTKVYLSSNVNALGEKESTSFLLAHIYRAFIDCQQSCVRGQDPGNLDMGLGCQERNLSF